MFFFYIFEMVYYSVNYMIGVLDAAELLYLKPNHFLKVDNYVFTNVEIIDRAVFSFFFLTKFCKF